MAAEASLQSREGVYSLYTSQPQLPALNSLPSARPVKSTETKAVAQLEEVLEEGGAIYALRDILTKEAKYLSKKKTRSQYPSIKNARRKPKQRSPDSGAEQDESEDAGDEVSEGQVLKKRKRTSRLEQRMELPPLVRPDIDYPPGRSSSCNVLMTPLSLDPCRSTNRSELRLYCSET